MKKIRVKSKNQTGGITAGVINYKKGKKKHKNKLGKWASIATIVVAILYSLNFFIFDNMKNKKTDTDQNVQEIYNVKSEKQTGGITTGKIETLNILTDKESLDIREPFGLYKDNKKVGTVVNPVMNEDKMIFTIDEIQLDKPMPMGDFSFIYSTFEFDKYVIRVNNARTITTTLPPGATGVKGEILEIK